MSKLSAAVRQMASAMERIMYWIQRKVDDALHRGGHRGHLELAPHHRRLLQRVRPTTIFLVEVRVAVSYDRILRRVRRALESAL